MFMIFTHSFDEKLPSLAIIKVAALALRSVRPCITSRVICETLLYFALPCVRPCIIGLAEILKRLAGTHGAFAWSSKPNSKTHNVEACGKELSSKQIDL